MGPLIRLAAVLCCAIVGLSFALFVIDESRASSEQQVESVAGNKGVTSDDVNAPAPAAGDEAVRERVHSSTREYIDDANDLLVRPFAAIATTDSTWANRLIAVVLALLLYGVLGGILANAFAGGPRETRDWREVPS